VQEFARRIREKLRQGGIEADKVEVFAKILTPNDDSGRHGVVVPIGTYDFLPSLDIADPTKNATLVFNSFDMRRQRHVELAYKYYERYPERRLTRIDPELNDRSSLPRLLVLFRVSGPAEATKYAHFTERGELALQVWALIAGPEVAAQPGAFVVTPLAQKVFSADANLQALLNQFDKHSGKWIQSLRTGDTGIGYTFESLLGIKENNDQTADFRGIEIKCKGKKDGKGFAAGKLNLFQKSPVWTDGRTGMERLRAIAQPTNGLLSCHSQLTTVPNNLGLFVRVDAALNKIDLNKETAQIGYWTNESLSARLQEKHSRAVFIKADIRSVAGTKWFNYNELIYCEKPDMDKFIALLKAHQLVFEFVMSEKPKGKLRNHGYPWRLTREDVLEHLFALKIRLR
jgi:hypothetical protein